MDNATHLLFHILKQTFINFYTAIEPGRQNGGTYMKKEELIVRCTYEGHSKAVIQILQESFCLFLQRELVVPAMEHGNRVS